MGDHQQGLAFRSVFERAHDGAFGVAIQAGSGFIQHYQLGGLEQGAGQGEALGLTDGEATGLISDRIVESLLPGKFPGLGPHQGGFQLGVAGRGPGQQQVVSQGGVEQLGVLGEPAQLQPPLAHVQLGELLAVDAERTAIGGKAEQGVDQRALAGPADPDQRSARACLKGEIDGADQHLALGAQHLQGAGLHPDGAIGLEGCTP